MATAASFSLGDDGRLVLLGFWLRSLDFYLAGAGAADAAYIIGSGRFILNRPGQAADAASNWLTPLVVEIWEGERDDPMLFF